MDEKTIIVGCRKGIPKYQKALVHKYSGMLMTVARRYSYDKSYAKDILQEGFVKIFRSLDKYKEQGAFEAWMRRIIIHTALKYFDKSSFKKEHSGLDNYEISQDVPQVFLKFNEEEIMNYIDKLPDGYKQVFNLYVVEGYSHQEIGVMLNIGESTSRSQLARARKILQQQITIAQKQTA